MEKYTSSIVVSTDTIFEFVYVGQAFPLSILITQSVKHPAHSLLGDNMDVTWRGQMHDFAVLACVMQEHLFERRLRQ